MDLLGEDLCPVCLSLSLTRQDFSDPPVAGNHKQGNPILKSTLGALRKTRECPLCRLILDVLQQNNRDPLPADDDVSWTLIWSVNNPEYDPVDVDVEDKYGWGLYASLGNSSSREYRIELVDEASTSELLRGQLLNENGIDIEQILCWIKRCHREHKDQHRRNFYNVPTHPWTLQFFMIIDVQKQCLVSLPEEAKYTALSYVWGSTNRVVTTTANLDQFCAIRALERVDLPKTIRDAINLTRDLGFSYIWIDSLCIVQDDETMKDVLISNMDAVYANAYVTIVAATGDNAEAGLPGFGEGLWASRRLHVEKIAPDLQLGILPHFDVELMESYYAKRAWT